MNSGNLGALAIFYLDHMLRIIVDGQNGGVFLFALLTGVQLGERLSERLS